MDKLLWRKNKTRNFFRLIKSVFFSPLWTRVLFSSICSAIYFPLHLTIGYIFFRSFLKLINLISKKVLWKDFSFNFWLCVCWWISRLEFHVYYFDSFVEAQLGKNLQGLVETLTAVIVWVVFVLCPPRRRQKRRLSFRFSFSSSWESWQLSKFCRVYQQKKYSIPPSLSLLHWLHTFAVSFVFFFYYLLWWGSFFFIFGRKRETHTQWEIPWTE